MVVGTEPESTPKDLPGVDTNVDVEAKPDEIEGTEGTTASEAKVILAELCAFAPNNDVRDCLRLFDEDKPIPQLRSAFNRKTKTQLTTTLELLTCSATVFYCIHK